jgi:hypothetical protein
MDFFFIICKHSIFVSTFSLIQKKQCFQENIVNNLKGVSYNDIVAEFV